MVQIFSKSIYTVVAGLLALFLRVIGDQSIPTSKHTDTVDALLSESLRNHRAQACDGQRLPLKCPLHTTIFVENTFYGRLVPSSELCPPSERRLKKKHRKSDNKRLKLWEDRYEDTSCDVTNAHTKIVQKCNNQRKCRVHARPQFFGRDPCPTTSKYLQISYKCKPSQFNNGYYCEGGSMQLRCRPRKRLAIFSAMYGRTADSSSPVAAQDSNCKNSEPVSSDCLVDVLPKIMSLCHAQRKCSLSITDDLLGHPPCSKNVKKYLSLIFMCVNENIFNEAALEGRFESLGFGSGEEDLTDYDKVFVQPEEKVVVEPEVFIETKKTQEKPKPNTKSKAKTELNNDAAFAPAYIPPHVYDEYTTTKSAVLERTTPAACLPPSVPNAVGFIHEWIATASYLSANKEKVILYFFLSASGGLILLLAMCIVQQCFQRNNHGPPSKRLNSADRRNGSKIELDSILNSPTVFDTESRVEISDFGRNGVSFMHFNHPTPPRTQTLQQYYS